MPNMMTCSSGTISALNWNSPQLTTGAGQHIANETAAKISRLNDAAQLLVTAHTVGGQREKHHRHRPGDPRPTGKEQRDRGDQQNQRSPNGEAVWPGQFRTRGDWCNCKGV